MRVLFLALVALALAVPSAHAGVSLITGDISLQLPSPAVLTSILESKLPDARAYVAGAWSNVPSQRLVVLSFENVAVEARVQLKAAIDANDDVSIVSYISGDAVLILSTPEAAISVAQAVPGVELGPYKVPNAIAPDWQRLYDNIIANPGGGARRSLAATGGGQLRVFDMLATRGGKYGLKVDLAPSLSAAALAALQQDWPGALAARLGSSAACAPEVSVPRLASGAAPNGVFEIATVFLCEKDLLSGVQWLAEQAPVGFVSPYLIPRKHDAVATISMQTGDITTAQFNNPLPVIRPYWYAGLQGENEIVGVTDTGIDSDSCWVQDPRYPGFYRSALNGLSGVTVNNPDHRKIVSVTVVPGSNSLDKDGHGTFTSGCVAAGQLQNPNNPLSPISNDWGTGMAPRARIAFTDVDDGNLFPSDMTQIPATHQAAGASITSFSWGIAFVQQYDDDQRAYDTFHWMNPDMVTAVSAGNEGDYFFLRTTIGSPASGKNIIAVGATKNTVSGKNSMASFSSFGPAYDGRYKPDISAPGEDIVSVRTRDMTPPNSYPVFDNSSGPTCTTVKASGTSFSCPLTAGALAVMRQYFRNGWYPSGLNTTSAATPFTPSGMLLKALIIAGAKSMQGGRSQFGGTMGAPPDRFQGFGRVNLRGTLPLATYTQKAFRLQVIDRASFTSQSDAPKVFTGLTANGPFVVVLTWYDYPAARAAKTAIINDLDLEVKAGSKTVLGNTLETATNASPDRLNTVERVLFNSPATGSAITITVKVAKLATELGAQPQLFSVAVLGAISGTLQSEFNPAWVKLSGR